MYRVACTRKEASCILGNFFSGLSQVCESCQRRPRDELALITRDGLKLTGEASLTIEGRSSITGEPATVKLTDYGAISRSRQARRVLQQRLNSQKAHKTLAA